MSVEDCRKVDAIGVDKITGSLVLSIIDEMDWSNKKEHLFLLEDKINAYINFIECGDLYDAYEDAKDRNIVIKIFATHEAPVSIKHTLEEAADVIEQRGYSLVYKLTGISVN